MNSYIVLDIETTGLDPYIAEVIEFAAICIIDGKEADRYQTLINPGTEIPALTSFITGIKSEDVADAPTLDAVKSEIQSFVGDLTIVGHNISFDVGFLAKKGIEFTSPTLDTCFLAEVFLPGMTSYSLENLSKSLELKQTEAHRAMGDVEATLDLFQMVLGETANTDPKILTSLKSVALKTPSSIYAEILDWKITGAKPYIQPTPKSLVQTFSAEQSQSQLDDIFINKKTIFENHFYEDELVSYLLTQTDRTILVAENFGELKKRFADYPEVHFFEDPSRFIDRRKFTEFISRADLSEHEMSFAWKILAGKGESIEDFTLRGNEQFRMFAEVACDSYDNATSQGKLWILSPKSFMTEELSGFDSLVIPNSFAFENAIFTARDFLATESFIRPSEAIKTFFKDLRDLFPETDSMFAEKYLLDTQLRSTDKFKAFHTRALELAETIAGTPEAQFLLEYFQSPSADFIYWVTVSVTDEVSLMRTPSTISELFAQRSSAFPRVMIGMPTSYMESYLTRVLGLDDYSRYQDGAWTQEIRIPWSDTIRKDTGFQLASIQAMIRQHSGRKVLFFTARNRIREFYEELGPILSVEGVSVYAEGIGGKRRILDNLLDQPDSVLLCSLGFLSPMTIRDLQLETAFLMKLPFESPKDPVLVSRRRQFGNDFREFTMPRVAGKLASRFARSIERIFILDPAAVSRDFGKEIIEVFGHPEKAPLD